MVKKAIINASELHRAAGKALKRVAINDELLVVERDGYPVAVLMSYQEYEQILRERALTYHRQVVHALGQESEGQGLTEEQLMTELEETKKEVYREIYGKD
jgi:PHD/YefM family antitoxin component YafN of YafNO toxin-antitoxin module